MTVFHKNPFNLIALIIAISLVFDGCTLSEKDRRVIIVLIDYSASSSDLVLNEYIKIINEDIFSNMSQYDYLAVMPIDEGSKREPVKIIDEDMVEKAFTKKSDGFTHANDSLQMRLSKYVAQDTFRIAQILREQREKRREYTKHTDIVGALQQTSNLIEENTKDDLNTKSWNFIVGRTRYKKENILVILSDMVHNSEDFSFNANKKVTDKQYQVYVDRLKEQNRIPDLKNCKVFVIGATGTNSTQIDRITSFWKNYFDLSHAQLKAYGYNVEDKLRKYLKNEDY